jgi:hypothetical protein
VSEVVVPRDLLAEGEYIVGCSLFTSRGSKARHLQVTDAISFQVFDPMEGPSARGDYAQRMSGVMRPLLAWSTSRSDLEEGMKR